MSGKIEAPRGTLDALPGQSAARERVLAVTAEVAGLYGYRPIVTPTFEATELFLRTAGLGSDVVSKEMYTFTDRADRSLTLRPEGTAGAARAYVEHGLHKTPQPVKAWYAGPMFRYAAPQKGRYREFWQVGFEAIGSPDHALDVELIRLFVEITKRLGLGAIRLELNSIGDRNCRPAYVEQLRAFLAEHRAELDDDARAKADTSPLRVFDTKSAHVAELLQAAPTIGGSLCGDCAAHFAETRALLDALGVSYTVNPTLVRGLDYYTRTVWEFVNDDLDAAQSTVCAGGRYDGLLEEIGGQPTPAVGWAAGVERLALSLGALDGQQEIDVFVIVEEPARRREALVGLAALRARGVTAETDYAGRSLKGQLTQAQRLGARTTLFVRADGIAIRRRGEGDIVVQTIEEAVDQL